MSDPFSPLTPDHPCAPAFQLAMQEINDAKRAESEGNHGRARVNARRAVGVFIQSITHLLTNDYGSNAMANLRAIHADISLTDEIRTTAERLLLGAHEVQSGSIHTADPVADAMLVILYFSQRFTPPIRPALN